MMLMMKVLVNIDPAKKLYKKKIKESGEKGQSLKCYENHSIIIYTRRKMIVLNSKLLND
jgi:hypothetical protein